MERHDRFMKQEAIEQEPITETAPHQVIEQQMDLPQLYIDNAYTTNSYSTEDQSNENKNTCDQENQVNVLSLECIQAEKTFICNRYMNTTTSCSDAEIQTEILMSPDLITVPNKKRINDEQGGTSQETLADQSVESDIDNNDFFTTSFAGFTSIENDEQLLDLAGVTFNHFQFLLSRVNDVAENCEISKENQLLIFLIKMKTGLTFSAISVLFSVDTTTISKIFTSTLQYLSSATADLVFWPSKDVVQETMPECFHPDYIRTRVIMDCADFRIEVPESVDNRVYTFSYDKKGFTAKVLIGMTPAGFVSFKSKVAGGKMSNSQLTIESGLIDLLENEDFVMTDKHLPEVRRIIGKASKNVALVVSPFSERISTENETDNTYDIARIRIHIERIMQRFRSYQILNNIPENLFNRIDDLIHMVCVLTNLLPPIISENNTGNNE